ncbi:MAG: M14 family metallopeptidase, partial [Gemmatimonadota bacterium]
SPLPVDSPKLRGIAVESGAAGVARLLFDVVAADSLDRAWEYRERASEEAIDRSVLSVEMLAGMVDELRGLHGAGLMERALSLDRVRELAFRFVLEDDEPDADRYERLVVLPRSRAPKSTDAPRLLARDRRWEGERLVQWETPIPPAENDSILARLATFPTVDVYHVARSFLGRDIWAMDLLPPHESAYVSQAKLNALKPTLFLSGRQHANEVSSTSHILRLAELLATDSAYAEQLNRVNVVLHPITNPDGARLAVEMQETNPDFMLHAGYLGALGVDATAGSNDPDAIYPESQVRPELMATWLPDVYVNMHGYPSHEWVQYFAGYSAWVRSRTGTSRTWWAPRGWFIPGFRWVDDEDHPEYTEAQFAALDAIAASITELPDVRAMSERMYARYAKYGRQDRESFREYFHEGMLVYLSLRGRESIGDGAGSPRITYVSLTTEAPDETARGDWLELVASAGLAHSTALLRWLAEGENRIERETEANAEFVTRSVWRVKPVLPKEPEGDGEDATAEDVAASRRER